MRRAATAPRGGRLYLLLAPEGPLQAEAIAAVPPGYRRVETRTFPGINPIKVLVYERPTASGA